MRYPEFLKPGGTIGFAAPSFGCSIEPYRSAFNHALEVFRRDGYQLQLGPNAYAGDGIGISSSPDLGFSTFYIPIRLLGIYFLIRFCSYYENQICLMTSGLCIFRASEIE